MFPFLQLLIANLVRATYDGFERPECSFTAKEVAAKHATAEEVHPSSAARDKSLAKVLRGGPSWADEMCAAVDQYAAELAAFARNRTLYPYDLTRDFDDVDSAIGKKLGENGQHDIPQCTIAVRPQDSCEELLMKMPLLHVSGAVAAFRAETMAQLEQLIQAWQAGKVAERLAEQLAGRATPTYVVFYLGCWTPAGDPASVLLVVGQLRADICSLLDAYLPQPGGAGGATPNGSPYLDAHLLHLGTPELFYDPKRFFDDLPVVASGVAQNEAVRSAKLQRLRMWQGKENKALRGGLVAMQCFFGEDGGVAGPVRGDSSNAQFFVDVVLGVDEYIRRLAGYLDEAGRGYGTLRLETSQGFAHSVGVRETGTYFEVTVPETSPYQLVAFAGECALSQEGGHVTLLKGLLAPRGNVPEIKGFGTLGRLGHTAPHASPSLNESTAETRESSAWASAGALSAHTAGLSCSPWMTSEPTVAGGFSIVRGHEERSHANSTAAPLRKPRHPAEGTTSNNTAQRRVRASSRATEPDIWRSRNSQATRRQEPAKSVGNTRRNEVLVCEADVLQADAVVSESGAQLAPLTRAGTFRVVENVPPPPHSHGVTRKVWGGQVDRLGAGQFGEGFGQRAEAQEWAGQKEGGHATVENEGGAAEGWRGWEQGVSDAVAHGLLTARSLIVLQAVARLAPLDVALFRLKTPTVKYARVASELERGAREVLWEYRIEVAANRTFLHWAPGDEAVTRAMRPRIGACEIVLRWQDAGRAFSLPIHSKLHTRKWPNACAICAHLCDALPRQYHRISFVAMPTEERASAQGVRVDVTMTEGADPLCLITRDARGAEQPPARSEVQKEAVASLERTSTVYTDEMGVATVALPSGCFTVRMSGAGFDRQQFHYTLGAPHLGLYEPIRRAALLPVLHEGDIKVCLTWRASPADLDLVAVTPHGKVWHAHPTQDDDGVRGGAVVLDRDVRAGWGPETLSIRALSEPHRAALADARERHDVHVFVHAASGEGELAGSGARLRVQSWQSVLYDEEAPTDGTGDFWDAFTLDLVTLQVRASHRIVPLEPAFEVRPMGSGDSVGDVTSVFSTQLGECGAQPKA